MKDSLAPRRKDAKKKYFVGATGQFPEKIVRGSLIPNRDPCPVCGEPTFCPKHYFGLSNDLIMVERTNKLEHWERIGPMIPFDKTKHIPKPVGNFYRIYVQEENKHG